MAILVEKFTFVFSYNDQSNLNIGWLINVQQWFSLQMWIQMKKNRNNKWITKPDHMTLEISCVVIIMKSPLVIYW
jgi:hypothetical protein